MKNDTHQFTLRLQALRAALLKLNFWIEQCIDEDIIPSITSEEELAEYEEIVAMEV